jgi:glycine dehydrogenase subunit 2
MIEPTESESQETLDQFVDAMISIAKDARDNPEVLHHAPHTTPVRRLDEVAAARKPNLRWRAPQSAAASTLCDSGATIKTVSPTHTST